MSRQVSGPFRYAVRADSYLWAAQRHAAVPVKQAVIAPSALGLLHPADDLSTSREPAFAKIAARAEGTALAPARLGVRAAHSPAAQLSLMP